MTQNKITKLLIANRGEIARRIQRTCQKMGIKTVCIASEADVGSLFAREAEELIVVGPAAPKDSYLAQEKIIDAAIRTKCEAIHPGYGFLSENALFADAVTKAGLIFVGPTAYMIESLGDKVKARTRAVEAGVPITRGTSASLSDSELIHEAEAIGFPMIIKAVAGGGGRGMRIVNSAEEMRALLPRARSEALKFFGSELVYLEQYIENPRHVEVQIMGDAHGNLLHFGTRDCSIQRRHQKLIEEAPAPHLSPGLREAIHTAALAVAKRVSYKSAGTAEFLVKGEKFYFLEMNTRIQVEHPVTEEVARVDLIELQIRVAQEEALALRQEEVTFSGHAIEFRLYAEDAEQDFMPSTGKITRLSRPARPYLRIEQGYEAGDEVTPFYDAMLEKIIVKGTHRREAIARSLEVLNEYEVQGVKSSKEFHQWLLLQDAFRLCTMDINFLGRSYSKESLRSLPKKISSGGITKKLLPGVQEITFLEYSDAKTGKKHRLEVFQDEFGTYTAKLADDSLDVQRMRMSYTAEGAVRALVQEVLQK